MWRIDNTSSGFGELGQSWSKPKVGYSKLNTSGYTASPVLFIGGGYDTNKDYLGLGSEDEKGRAIYMLDAKTGALLWSMAPTDATTIFSGTDSIPSTIGLLDSSGDGLVDRLYAGDTGGNVWRVDMPGADKTKFSVFKLASFGSETDDINDQRFFYEPTIVRTFISETVETTVSDGNGGTETITVHQEIPYDAVLIGSGDRSNPLGKDTKDTLYMIKDNYIVSQTFSGTSTPPTPTAFTKTNLYNYTDNPFSKTMTTQEEETLQVAVSAQSGWYMDLLQSGEKNSASGLVIHGIAYFTTYTPALLSGLVDCKPPEGSGNLYAVDLVLGVSKHVVKTDVRENDDRVIKVNDEWLGSPTLIVLPEDDGDITTKDDGKGDIIVGDAVIPVGFDLSTSRNYLYRTEQQ
jgi:type IV pilus assembly protein PilY1